MKRLTFILGVVLAGSAFARLAEAQNVATLVVNAPKLILTAGESTQLRAGARDNQGRTVGGGVLQWTSSNPAVASVDGSGGLTAHAIGVTNITVRSGLVTSPALTLQVLPLRLEI